MFERARELLADHRVQDTGAVLIADAASISTRHLAEVKAMEDFILFVLTVAFLVWRWRRESRNSK